MVLELQSSFCISQIEQIFPYCWSLYKLFKSHPDMISPPRINLLFYLIKKYTLSVPHYQVQEQSPVSPDSIARIVIVNEDFANALRSLFFSIEIALPHRTLPDSKFLQYHNDVIFKR